MLRIGFLLVLAIAIFAMSTVVFASQQAADSSKMMAIQVQGVPALLDGAYPHSVAGVEDSVFAVPPSSSVGAWADTRYTVVATKPPGCTIVAILTTNKPDTRRVLAVSRIDGKLVVDDFSFVATFRGPTTRWGTLAVTRIGIQRGAAQDFCAAGMTIQTTQTSATYKGVPSCFPIYTTPTSARAGQFRMAT